jgi:tetratricopeptide (TPR) repeat protein
MRFGLLLLALALCSFGRSTAVRAEADRTKAVTKDAAPPGYEQSVERALREFELANYAEARTMLLNAHALFPNARTLRGLGMVEYELKNYPAAAAYLEQALASRERPLTPEQRTSVEELRRAAQGYIGRYTLALRPGGATVLVDGDAPNIDARGLLVLVVGDHQIEVSAEGYHAQRRTLHVVGGEARALDLVLLPITSSETSAANAPANVDKPLYKKWWLWTTIGLVVAAGVTTGVVLATREHTPQEPTGGSLNETIRLLSVRR